MTDVTIYKPASVRVKSIGNNQYTIILLPGMTIQAINVAEPVDHSLDPPLQAKARASLKLAGSLKAV